MPHIVFIFRVLVLLGLQIVGKRLACLEGLLCKGSPDLERKGDRLSHRWHVEDQRAIPSCTLRIGCGIQGGTTIFPRMGFTSFSLARPT